MRTSEQINELASALSKCQRVLKNPEKNRTVKVRTKAGGEYSFDYATLDSILDIIREPMADNGLSLLQVPDGEIGKLTLTSRLLHVSGQYIESSLPILPVEPGPQGLGSAITYVRRYALTSLLGLCAEEDDDGNQGSGNFAQPQSRQQANKTPQPQSNNQQRDKPPVKGNAPAKNEPAELSPADALTVARTVKTFSEVECHDDYKALLDILRQPNSVVKTAENPALVRAAIFAAIKNHPHAEPPQVEQGNMEQEAKAWER